MSTGIPSVLFVCVKNGGKSQMAAALARQLAGDRVEVVSAGTRPGAAVNALSEEVVREVGGSMDGEYPKPIDPVVLGRADLVVVLGQEAVLPPTDRPVEVWVTDEPSDRGIEGVERMRLVRDDIRSRVVDLVDRLVGGDR